MPVIGEIIKKYSKSSSILVCVWKYNTPIGTVIAGADEKYLLIVMFEDSKNIEKRFKMLADEIKCTFINEANEVLKKFDFEINEYFIGKLKKFTVPIKTFGSDFQKEVWNKLIDISYASTLPYSSLAMELGRPTSHSRAVGGACGANAHIIVVPCHRVVSSNSKGGFSCGLDRKEWLLQHEKKFEF